MYNYIENGCFSYFMGYHIHLSKYYFYVRNTKHHYEYYKLNIRNHNLYYTPIYYIIYIYINQLLKTQKCIYEVKGL
jgi:hypothetical protein